jgi:cytochrome c peroxidase
MIFPTYKYLSATIVTIMILAVGCDCGKRLTWNTTPYTIDIPAFFPPMDIPADNPMTVEGIKLGRLLFWEKALSLDKTISCGSCHSPDASFSDSDQFSVGVNGTLGNRNASAIINMGWSTSFFWDGRAESLEDQARVPVAHPLEMNVDWGTVVNRLQNDDFGNELCYPQLFFDAFGTDDISENLSVKAIAQFMRTMISADSKFDRWRRGETQLTDLEYMGYQLFLKEGGDPEDTPGGEFGADCFHCHGEAGLQFSDYLFHNNGLDATFENDPGRVDVTGWVLDSGKFKTPTLRNVALSGPFMHDGRFNTLEEVIEHYNSGGVPSTTIDTFMKYTSGGLQLAPQQKDALLAFLHALTDTTFTVNPDFQDPH